MENWITIFNQQIQILFFQMYAKNFQLNLRNSNYIENINLLLEPTFESISKKFNHDSPFEIWFTNFDLTNSRRIFKIEYSKLRLNH